MQSVFTIIDDLTREETAPSVAAAFPYRGNLYDLNAVPERLCPWHWHNEVELFYIPNGAIEYHLPGRSCVFRTGDVGFVNANVLHMTTPLAQEPCLQQEHIFLPRLVGGLPGDAIETKYVAPLVRNAAADLIRIPGSDPAAPALRKEMDRAFAAFTEREPGYELRIRGLMSELWLQIAARVPGAAPAPAGGDTSRIKAMLQYIEAHFAEPITLAEIASAARIGAREASRCFRRQLDTTAFEYLLTLRIDRACELLRGSDLAVTEVATRCGFSSSSYFSKVFRERMGATPREYRRARAER